MKEMVQCKQYLFIKITRFFLTGERGYHKSKSLNFLLLVVIVFLVTSCGNDTIRKKDTSTSVYENVYNREHGSQDSLPGSDGASDRRNPESVPTLSYQEWYQLYTAAYNECSKDAPRHIMYPEPIGPDSDFMLSQGVDIKDENEVRAIMAERYPEIFAYYNIPEYREYLQKTSYREFIEHWNATERLNRQLENELEDQVERNDREIQQYREMLERQRRNYQPSRYGL